LPWQVIKGGGKEKEKRSCGQGKKNGDRRRGGTKEHTGEKERKEGTDEQREERGHGALCGDILEALSKGLEVF